MTRKARVPKKITRRLGVSIRAAESGDVDQLLALFDEVAGERKWIATEPGFDRGRYRESWLAIISGASSGAIFVACDGSDVVGSLSIYLTQNGDHQLGMLVKQGRRGEGIGTALLVETLTWAMQNKVPALSLGVFPHNKAAIHLYEKMGFVRVGYRDRQMKRPTGETWDVLIMEKPLHYIKHPDAN
jgi:ribosomal protein S18 acetylase RimI-like enzyme